MALLAMAGTALSFPAAAAPLVLTGNYIKIGLNDKGTLGFGGSTSPGILYDGTGTGTFNPAYDYLTPGNPFEGFAFAGTASGAFSLVNNNSGAAAITGALTSYNGVAYNGATYDQRAVWTGTAVQGGVNIFTVTHDYYFNLTGQQLNITTTIEALTDLSGLQFGRFTDPDAVAAAGDTSSTNNVRGATGVDAKDIVYAEALVSKYVIGLFTTDPTTHNSAVTGWTSTPASYLAGTSAGNGDLTIGLGFDIGALLNGGRIILNYKYIFGTNIGAAIGAAGGGASPPAPPPIPDIVEGGPYTVDQLMAGQVNPVFDGGTLTLASSGSVATDFTVRDAGGTIDTDGNDLTLSGVLSGPGTLRKDGAGTLTLTGANEQNGLDIQGGVVIVGSQGALGASGGQIVLGAGGGLVTGADMTITQGLQTQGGRFDTGGQNVVLTGVLTGDACFNKFGSGRLSLNAPGSNAIGACVKEGALSFNSAFVGNVWVDPAGTMSGSGRVDGDVQVSGVLAPGNSPGVLVVDGAVAQGAGSTLALDIDGPTAGSGAGHHDSLVLTGAGGVYTAGGAVAPILRGISGAATNSFTPQIGDAFQVVTAEGGVLGAFASVTQPTAGLPANSRIDVVYLPKAVVLAVTPVSYAKIVAGGSLNAQGLAASIDAHRPGPAERADPARGGGFLGALMGLREGQIRTVLQQAPGELHADTLDAAVQGRRAGRAQIAGRLEDAFTPGRRVWGAAASDTWEVEADAAAAGYETEGSQLVFGFDSLLTPDLLVGVAASYGEGDVDAGLMGSARTVSYQAHGYAAWRRGPYYVQGVVSAGQDTYRTNRSVAFAGGPRAYASKADGTAYAADLELGRRLALGPAELTLAAGLAGDRAERDGLTETGDAIGALRFESQTREALQGRIGGRVGAQADLGGIAVAPAASLFVTQEFGDAASRLDAQMNGLDLTVAAASPGRTAVRFETKVDAALSERARLSLGYRYGWSDRAEGHAVRAAASFTW